MNPKDQDDVLNLSSDIFVRASVIGKIIRIISKDKFIKILDVGGYQGRLGLFVNSPVKVLDVFDVTEENYIKGDARKIDFPDNYFDVVTSIETLEHIREEDREKVLGEIVRVSKDLVIISCPTLTEENKTVENFANDFYKSQTGDQHPWLKEHKEYTLPKEDLILKVLKNNLKDVQVIENDPLVYWLEIILLHFFDILTKEEISSEIQGLYRQFNRNLALGYPKKPVYRKIFIGRKNLGIKKRLAKEIYGPRPSFFSRFVFNYQITKFFVFNEHRLKDTWASKFIGDVNKTLWFDMDEKMFFSVNLVLTRGLIFLRNKHDGLNRRSRKLLSPIRSLKKTMGKVFEWLNKKRFGSNTFVWRFIKPIVPEALRRRARFNRTKIDSIKNVENFNTFYQKSYEEHFSGTNSIIDLKSLKYKPRISIIMPVFNTSKKWLRLAIESVVKQQYPNWELSIVDDGSANEETKAVLMEYESKKDKRIKVKFRDKRGGISIASNDSLLQSTGEFVALLDHDDEIAPNALAEVVSLLNQRPDTDFVYSDEDKIDRDGVHCDPYFKPDWSPDMILSNMYTTHLSIYRKKLVETVGGFRVGYEGSQDYDLVLRISEVTKRIEHIPKILYHWRKISGSTSELYHAKSYAHNNAKRALVDAVERRGLDATVEQGLRPDLFRIHYRIKKSDKVSIIIPTKDKLDFLKRCVSSILERTTYNNYEIVIVDNDSLEEETTKYLRLIVSNPRVKVLFYPKPFNYSSINNFAVKNTLGDYLLFLNNDTEVLDSDWLSSMVELAQREDVGAVGAKLLYPEGYIQHIGVVLGIGGIAGHVQKMYADNLEGLLPIFNSKDMIRNWSCVTAACMLLRRKTFDEIGGFDEDFRIAFNDVDLCLRLRKKGYLVIFTPYARLTHYESASVGLPGTGSRDLAEFLNENEMMHKRWGDLLSNDPYYNPNLTLQREDFSLRILDTESVVVSV